MGTQKLLKFLHVFFHNNNFWDSVFLVFTRWYYGVMTEKDKQARLEYAEKVRQIARECIGTDEANPQLPCYFVDAKDDFDSFDINTKNEFALIHAFACGKQPIVSAGFQAPDLNYFKLIPEEKKDVLISETISANGMVRTRIYANQTRNKQISYDGTVSYSDWVNASTRKDVKEKTIKKVPRKVQIKQRNEQKWKTVRCGGLRGLAGGRKTVLDCVLLITTYQDQIREITTDFDGNVSYGEWKTIKEYEESTRQ